MDSPFTPLFIGSVEPPGSLLLSGCSGMVRIGPNKMHADWVIIPLTTECKFCLENCQDRVKVTYRMCKKIEAAVAITGARLRSQHEILGPCRKLKQDWKGVLVLGRT